MPADNENVLRGILTSAIEEAISIIDRNIKKWGNKLPDIADAGVYDVIDGERIKHNTSWRFGFGIGIVWLLYEYTGNKMYLEAAERMLETFVQRPDSQDQCQGVLHIPSCVAAYRYTGDKKAATAAMNGANLLVNQFSKNGGYIRAFKNYENFVVDSAVNTVLLHWASEYSGNPMYYEIARKHLDTEMKYSLRPDGSTYHVYWFDNDGNAIEGTTAQGYDDSSCWSRGQAWAMLGYALHYRFTGDKDYLSTFRKLSKYYFEHLNSDEVPSWDLIFVDSNEHTDSAAAAIASCAVFEMANLLPDDAEIARFKERAVGSVISLIRKYAAKYDDYIDALLIGGADNVNRGGYDESLIYGDYFYLEALLRLLGSFDTFWK